jgi:CBS domain-containing protein
MLTIHELMTLRPVTVTPQTTLGDLMARFDRYDFNAFPVVGEGGALLGIVTKLDVLRVLRRPADVAFERSPAEWPTETIMRRGVVAVEPDDPVIAAADLMVETRLRSLPVVRRSGGSPPLLIGIVTQGDLVRGLRFDAADRPLATPSGRSAAPGTR